MSTSMPSDLCKSFWVHLVSLVREKHVRSTITSIVSGKKWVKSFTKGMKRHAPLSSMSSDEGVSSSCIRAPSYKNLKDEKLQRQKSLRQLITTIASRIGSKRPCISWMLHTTDQAEIERGTHLMLLTSLPTLLAYAPWSLLNLVLLLILKKTSSPPELTT